MSDKKDGLVRKFHVTKLSNPLKQIDSIVLEFDDQLSREAILAYANIMKREGFDKFAIDLVHKCNDYERREALPVEDAR